MIGGHSVFAPTQNRLEVGVRPWGTNIRCVLEQGEKGVFRGFEVRWVGGVRQQEGVPRLLSRPIPLVSAAQKGAGWWRSLRRP